MTAYLPPNLLALFAAREPVEYWPPLERPENHRRIPYSGVAHYLSLFEDPSETPAPVKVETREEKRERKRREKAEQIAYKVEQDLALWNPLDNANATKDPYKTLFVARVSYDTTESKLKREFEVYGPIKQIKMIKDVSTMKPRGYCFIEYEHERDMHAAYKHANEKKIDGRRVLVDVERARTVKNWRPRRLGGGLGSTRKAHSESGRDRDRDERRSSRRSRSKDKRAKRDHRSRDRDRKKRSRSGGRDKKKRDRSRSRDKDSRKKRRSRSRDKAAKKSKRDHHGSSRRERDENNGNVGSNVSKYGEYGADME